MEAPEVHVPHGHASTGRKWLDLLLPITATIVSLVSIVIAIHSGQTMERLVAADTWPYFEWQNGNTNDEGERVITLTLRNAVAGPAKLRWVRFVYNGRPVRQWPELMKACCAGGKPVDTDQQAIALVDGTIVTDGVQGRVLLPGDKITVIRFPLSAKNAEVWKRFNTERFRVTREACYCSVFDECYKSKLNGSDPEHVEDCGQPKDDWSAA